MQVEYDARAPICTTAPKSLAGNMPPTTTNFQLGSLSEAALLTLLPPAVPELPELLVQHAMLKAPHRKRKQKGLVPRAQQNRMSAQRVRDRQRAKEEFLEETANRLDQENDHLEAQCQISCNSQSVLLAELSALKSEVSESATRLLEATTESESETDVVISGVSPAPSWSSDDATTVSSPFTEILSQYCDRISATAASLHDTPLSFDTSLDTVLSPGSSGNETASLPLVSPCASNIEHERMAFGEESCESAALAHPPQQDILSFAIVLQLVMRTTLNWATTLRLMTAMLTVTSRPSFEQSSLYLPATFDALALQIAGNSTSNAIVGHGAYPPRLTSVN